MHLPAFQKLLALFISGSILISSAPVYAGEITSLTESAISEVSAEQDGSAGISDEEDNCPFADEDSVGSETEANGSESNIEEDSVGSDSETDVSESDIEEGSKSSRSGAGGQNIDEEDTNTDDSDTSVEGDTNTDDPDTSVEDDSTPVRAIKNEPFAHMYHDDENDPAYDELREELDAIFQNSQLQDITDLPTNYSLVSLPFGGEGSGGSVDRSAPIRADQGRDVLA